MKSLKMQKNLIEIYEITIAKPLQHKLHIRQCECSLKAEKYIKTHTSRICEKKCYASDSLKLLAGQHSRVLASLLLIVQ